MPRPSDMSSLSAWTQQQFDLSLAKWADVEWIENSTELEN
jgi:L-lactate dehydrogenase (cytochrome)